MQAETASGKLITRRVSLEDRMHEVRASATTPSTIGTPRSARTEPLNFQIHDESGLLFSQDDNTSFTFENKISPKDVFAALQAYKHAIRINPNIGKIKTLRFNLKTKSVKEVAKCVIEFDDAQKIISANLTTQKIGFWRKYFSFNNPLQTSIDRFQKKSPKLTLSKKALLPAQDPTIPIVSPQELVVIVQNYLKSDNREVNKTIDVQLEDGPATLEITLNNEKTEIHELELTKKTVKFYDKDNPEPFKPALNKAFPKAKDISLSLPLEGEVPPSPRVTPLDKKNIVHVTNLFNHKPTDLVSITKKHAKLNNTFTTLLDDYKHNKAQRLEIIRGQVYRNIVLDKKETYGAFTAKNFVADLDLFLGNVGFFSRNFGKSALAYKTLKSETEKMRNDWMVKQMVKPVIKMKMGDNRKISGEELSQHIDSFKSEKTIKKLLETEFSLSWRQRKKYLTVFYSVKPEGNNSNHATVAAHNLAITCVRAASPAA